MNDPTRGMPVMKEMNHKSIEELGFPQVVQQIQKFCLSEEGVSFLQAMEFTSEHADLFERQQRIGALLQVLDAPGAPQLSSFPSVQASVEILSIPTQQLEGGMLIELAAYIDAAEDMRRLLYLCTEDGKTFLVLHQLMEEHIHAALIDLGGHIHAVLDESGQVRESHPALSSLRKQVESLKGERARFCGQFITKHRDAMQADQEALRDGRLVLPVRSDRRSFVQGFISSTSSSGNTVFMEPYALVELNNSVVIAQNQILIEIAKILKQLNDEARSVLKLLIRLSEQIGQSDAYYALARWAQQYDCSASDLQVQRCNLVKATHPLLGKKAIPISISLDEQIKAVVISGPNAGGKTVTMKTVGLFALLNQFCGYLPAQEGSSLPLFDAIFTDIGDEQSIEEQLSTFSGHMKQVGYIVRTMTNRSLVILDELGSGTDPVEGSAIARAILEYCLKHAELTLITSHHGVLKQFAYAKQEVINASMEFNEQSHLPTFRVIQGLPGESHALDTARLMKVPKEVVDRAKQYLGSEAVQIGSIIKDLESKRRALEQEEKAMHDRYLSLQQEVKRQQLKELQLKQREHALRDEQNTALFRFMREKRKELENLVSDLKQGELDATKTKQVKTYIKSLETKVEEEQTQLEAQQEALEQFERVDPKQLAVGTEVLCGSARRLGTILKQEGRQRFLVQVGSMRMTLKADQMTLAKKQDEPTVSVMYHSSAPEPKICLDVRGRTLEEALKALDEQIESALVHGMSTFSIIHGYGDGILSKGIGEYLKHHQRVQDYRFALPEDGGMGKTYVML
jgi:DNA mismatch repair protein MutS2